MDQVTQDLNSLNARLEAVQTNLALQSMKQVSSQDECELEALAKEKINLQYKIAFAKVMASSPNHS